MKDRVNIYRDENGVPHVEAETIADLYWGQGYVHACDRGMQMLLMRIIGQGRLCELLDDSEASLKIDTFFRRMNWQAEAELNRQALLELGLWGVPSLRYGELTIWGQDRLDVLDVALESIARTSAPESA